MNLCNVTISVTLLYWTSRDCFLHYPVFVSTRGKLYINFYSSDEYELCTCPCWSNFCSVKCQCTVYTDIDNERIVS